VSEEPLELNRYDQFEFASDKTDGDSPPELPWQKFPPNDKIFGPPWQGNLHFFKHLCHNNNLFLFLWQNCLIFLDLPTISPTAPVFILSMLSCAAEKSARRQR
jgi:hypothetical protein